MTARQAAQLAAVLAFVDEHGYTLRNAASVYVERFRADAEALRKQYERVSADPALSAAQDASLMTTNGLLQSARLFTEAADRTERAARALEELEETLTEGEEGERSA